MKAKILLVSLIILASGCVESANVGRAPLNLPNPQPLRMRPVLWVVLPPNDNAPEGDPTKKEAVIGLYEGSYKNLSQNFREILNYMATQRKIIQSYREYYESNK